MLFEDCAAQAELEPANFKSTMSSATDLSKF